MTSVFRIGFRLAPPIASLFFSIWASGVAPDIYILAEQFTYAALILSTVYASNIRHEIIKFGRVSIKPFDKTFFLITVVLLIVISALGVIAPESAFCIFLLSIMRFQSLLYAGHFIRSGKIISAALFQYYPIFMFQGLVATMIVLDFRIANVQLLISWILALVVGVLFWVGRGALSQSSSGDEDVLVGAPFIRLSVLLQQLGKRADAIIFSSLSESLAVAYLIAKRLFGLCDMAADYFKFLLEPRVANAAFLRMGASYRARQIKAFRLGVAISAIAASIAVSIQLASTSQMGQAWFIFILGAECFAIAMFGPLGMLMNYHNLAYQRFVLLLPTQFIKIGLLVSCVFWESFGLQLSIAYFAVEFLTLFIAKTIFDRGATSA